MKAAAIDVVRTLRVKNFQAYLVGGCVRDLLLGREPADYDVATDATPDQVMEVFPKTFAVGAQFGVVLVPYREDDQTDAIEVATFRKDGVYSDGRHPDAVTYAKSPEEDVRRRDFTINGMMMDPLTEQVLDFVGGQEDIKRKIIRTIGDPERRFTEDKLRLMRAVRFAARFGYEIEPQTFAAIRHLATAINDVSRERIRDELTKMLTEGHARRAFELLDETGLLQQTLPEVAKMKGVEQPPQYHPEGDVWTHTLMLLGGLEAGCSSTLAWGALLHDVGKPPTFRRAPDRIRFDNHAEIGMQMAKEICHRMRVSNEETDQIAAIVANHMKFPDLPRMRQSTLKKFLRMPKIEEHLEMHRLDCLASHGDLSLHEFASEKLRSIPEEQIRPEPLITGADLIALGLQPGPQFKEILSEIEDAQLEGTLVTKADALEAVKSRFLSGNKG